MQSDTVDDIVSLENGGQKAVVRLAIRWGEPQENAKPSIAISFEDGGANPKNWDSVSISVVGDSRDAVFVAASDLEERVKKTRTRSWHFLLSRPWSPLVPVLISIVLLAFSSRVFSPALSAVDQLEQEYNSEHILDPIQAMIFLERAKATPGIWRSVAMFSMPFAIPFLAFGLAYLFVQKFSYSYVFYWGDSVARYDKRASLVRIFWIVVVLGIVASVIAGLILRALGA